MLGYTRRQLVLLFVVVAIGAAGLAIDHWRRANPDVVAYLETLDRAATPPPHEPAPRRVATRAADTSHGSSREPRTESPRGRRTHAARGDETAPLDLNLASAADFERLPGVGAALAARIVDVREREGPFGSVDDLARVRGVGRARLERLRPRLAVNTP